MAKLLRLNPIRANPSFRDGILRRLASDLTSRSTEESGFGRRSLAAYHKHMANRVRRDSSPFLFMI